MSAPQISQRAQKILDQLKSSQEGGLSTNINNINYNNYTNNINYKITSMFVCDQNNQEGISPDRASLGLASLSASSEDSLSSEPCSEVLALPKEIHFESGSELPAAWLNFKWDLFHNGLNKDGTGKLKLNCNIIKQDGSQQRLVANLNSPHDRVWRKVTQEDRPSQHWRLVAEQLRLWSQCLGQELTNFRASKFALPNKSGSVEVVVLLAELPDRYCVRMLYRAKMFDYEIPKQSRELLTVKQIQGNQVATLFVGRPTRKFVSLDDLGI